MCAVFCRLVFREKLLLTLIISNLTMDTVETLNYPNQFQFLYFVMEYYKAKVWAKVESPYTSQDVFLKGEHLYSLLYVIEMN